MKAYKVFGKGLVCQGYEYKLDEENVHDGDVNLLIEGFHSCVDPIALEEYYDVKSSDNVYAIVDVYGDTKFDMIYKYLIASKKLKIIKTFDTYKDLAKEFKKKGNPTIEYLEELRHAGFKFDEETVVNAIKEISGVDGKTDLSILQFMFALLVLRSQDRRYQVDLFKYFMNIVNVLVDILQDKGIISQKLMSDILDYKIKGCDLALTLSTEDVKKFNEYVTAFNNKFNVDIYTTYDKCGIYMKGWNSTEDTSLSVDLPKLTEDEVKLLR